MLLLLQLGSRYLQSDGVFMKDNRDSLGFILGLVVGSVVGATAAIMLAPDSGKNTRENLKFRAYGYKDKISLLAAEYRDKISLLAAEYRDKLNDLKENTDNDQPCCEDVADDSVQA